MGNILVLGYLPPTMMLERKIEAANYRTGQFLNPLLADGHKIFLCANETYRSQAVQNKEHHPALSFKTLDFSRTGWKSKLQKLHDTIQPDCIVAINFDICLYASTLSTDRPIWMDIYGDPLTIMQASFYRSGSNRGLPTTLSFMNDVLTSGDKYSVCSTTQEHMLVGELAMAGRLNYQTFGYRFAEVILPGAETDDQALGWEKDRSILKEIGIHEEDFVALWCGGYNTWTDVETLFSGLEYCMERHAKFHYVSVGANTYASPDNVYTELIKKIQQSAYRNRYHMLGWRPWHEVKHYYRESDVGINIDAYHYETIYGTRTRLLEMMAGNLPIVTSRGAELSYYLENRNACLGFSIGNWQEFGDAILLLAQNPVLREELASRAYKLTQTDLSFETTTNPLRSWVKQPGKAPDLKISRREKMDNIVNSGRSILRKGIWKVAGLSK